MSESAIRTKIEEMLEEISDIGKVHDYDRWAKDWSAFINLFKDGKAIKGWEITRRAAPAQYDSNAEEMTTHHYLIRGYRSLDDSAGSEKIFNAAIEEIRAKFRFDFTLGGICEHAGPVGVETVEVRTFGSVLCHYCELVLPVEELYSA
jgi:hypothetical protein